MGPTLQMAVTMALISLVTSTNSERTDSVEAAVGDVVSQGPTLPAVRARITRRGLDYGAKTAIDMMMKNQHLLKLPEELIPVTVGTSTMTVSNTVIRKLPRPLLKITPIPAVTTGDADFVEVNVTNCHPTVDATLKISQNWGLFTSEREVNITATLTNLVMSIKVAVEIDRFGRPMPSNIQCYANGEISFVLKGDFQRFTWFVNQVYNTMRRQFNEKIFEQVCSNTILEINKYVDNELKTVPMWSEFENGYKFDYRLLEKPKIREHFMETSHKGTMSLVGEDEEEHRLSVPQIPPYNHMHNDRMAYMYVTDTLVNSVWYAAMRNDQLKYTFNQNMTGLWKSVLGYLKTSCPGSICIGTIFSQLSQQYPNSSVTVDVYAVNTSYVPLQINGRSLILRCKGIADFYIETAESRQKIFSISVTMAATVTLGMSGNKLTFDVRPSSFRLDGDILSTPPGFMTGFTPIAEMLLDTYLTVVSSVVLQPLQVIGRQGLPLFVPNVPDLKFVNPVIINHNDRNILIIGTDVEYTVPRIN